MNSAAHVTGLIQKLKEDGEKLQNIAWEAATACVGWAYVYGARGQECTPSYRRSAYNSHTDHPTIKSACNNFEGKPERCLGCKWFPGAKRTRVFDCRGFTYWILKQVYGWELKGAGATSQWNDASNWKAKGKIADEFPADTLVCLFYKDKNNANVMAHTGFGLNNETVECSNGVQHSTTRNKKWTHWAVPACIDGEIPTPVPPDPGTTKPTLRRGSKGAYVKELQTALVERGYSVGSYGIDGDYGRATEAAVKEFQKDTGLTVDGVCGPKTWAALEGLPETELYTVTIPHLPLVKAQAIANQYNGATLVPEGGE